GKTTLARVIAERTGARFIPTSAVLAGVKEVREAIEEARRERRRRGRRTIFFLDEIHRFNKAQQDALLPHVEEGTITLIGATTENPSFEVIGPLLSRSRVFVLNPLSAEEIRTLLVRALGDGERGLAAFRPEVSSEALDLIANLAGGDARQGYNILELAVLTTPPGPPGPPGADGKRRVGRKEVEEAAQQRHLLYDRAGEEHYNLISAFIKTLRASDPDASLYWLARMLASGEDPMFLLRRMAIFASEDVGMADPMALVVATAAQQAFHFVGLPEGKLALAQAAIYLATAPKSNTVYRALGAAEKALAESEPGPVPLPLRKAPTPLMESLGYGKGYQYPHDFPEGYVPTQGLPENLRGQRFYEPSEYGKEKEVKERLERWRRGGGKGKKS
ncbi:MAG: replication-associated recombination protein A, partial [Candidatus Binatia bacterium]